MNKGFLEGFEKRAKEDVVYNYTDPYIDEILKTEKTRPHYEVTKRRPWIFGRKKHMDAVAKNQKAVLYMGDPMKNFTASFIHAKKMGGNWRTTDAWREDIEKLKQLKNKGLEKSATEGEQPNDEPPKLTNKQKAIAIGAGILGTGASFYGISKALGPIQDKIVQPIIQKLYTKPVMKLHRVADNAYDFFRGERYENKLESIARKLQRKVILSRDIGTAGLHIGGSFLGGLTSGSLVAKKLKQDNIKDQEVEKWRKENEHLFRNS